QESDRLDAGDNYAIGDTESEESDFEPKTSNSSKPQIQASSSSQTIEMDSILAEIDAMEWEKNNYTRYMLTKYGLNYINNLKTPEAWLQFAKYHPPKYIRERLLIPGYEINSKNHWENFVFHIKTNLTSHKQIDNDLKYRDFKVQLALYKENRASLIIQQTYRLWKKQINSAKIIQHAVIKWLYRPDGIFAKRAQDRYYCEAMTQRV
ncbi:4221_t:CDS:2, partial [Racocetra fulgida]